MTNDAANFVNAKSYACKRQTSARRLTKITVVEENQGK